tara:strand:+ start:52 stop:879 length:828 start_codon:yes stop_codon:yes gene_type:complete
MNSQRKKILFLSSEIAPFNSTYQLAEFSKKISMIMNEKEEIDIRISQPKYGFISERKYILREVIRLKDVPVNFDGKERNVSIKSAFIPNTRVQVYFVLDKDYFATVNPLIYKSKNGQFIKNNFERYSLFCLSLLESFKKLFWYPDIIICNDWQTSILPILLKEKYFDNDNYNKIKTINFIHSITNDRKIDLDFFKKFDLNIKFRKGMDVLSESMNFFDFNVLLDTKDKKLLSKINKNKSLSSNYKKSKSINLVYPDDNESWFKLSDKIDSLINKL